MFDIPILKREDEEFQMIREVARNVTDRLAHAKERGEKLTTRQISGEETEKVVRDHLVRKGFRISRNRVFINASTVEIDLLLLRSGIEPNSKYYSPNQVSTVLEVKNNAVGSEQKNPNVKIRNDFNELEDMTKMNRFVVVVLSENPNYKWRITEKEIEKKNCRVFTCVLRRTPRKLYDVDTINEMLENRKMWKTGEWEKLLAYLKE
jgi:hypothetical protein